MSIESLKILEAKIGEMLTQHEQTRKEHASLLQRAKEQEKLVAALTAQVKQFEQERTEMKTRLERLLARVTGGGTP